MKRIFALVVCSLLTAGVTSAQSKVFKEVSDEISSSMEPIIQDGTLVGYLVFTQLEKASEDSFNYKIAIMDENLNDIGTVKFRDEKLDLQAVSFEQDVLCLAYLKSNITGREFKNGRAYRKAYEASKTAVVTQFLNLDGKILKENYEEVVINKTPAQYYTNGAKFTVTATLKHKIQLTNIPQKGFACFFGDENNSKLSVYSASGARMWERNIDEAKGYSLLTSSEDIFLLYKKQDAMIEGGYSVAVYNIKDNKQMFSYDLKDHNGNSLKALDFGNDPQTGKPYISGSIIDKSNGNNYTTLKQLSKRPYDGVFTLNFNGEKRNEVKEAFTYWSDGSQSSVVSKSGRFSESNAYTKFATSLRDYSGNTYFVGPAFIKKTKVGAVITDVILSPLIVVSPFLLMTTGTQKFKIVNAIVLKQTPAGVLSVESAIECNVLPFRPGRMPLDEYDNKRYYQVTNSTTKTNYIIVDDPKDIRIYNLNQKKVARTVSHKDGQIRTYIFPAKEGYVMVAEFNKKEKYTRLSIEAL